jgi:hypothetical protein
MRKKLTTAEEQILNGLKRLEEEVDRELIYILKKLWTLEEIQQLLLEKNLV